jgi:hypothetical protein
MLGQLKMEKTGSTPFWHLQKVKTVCRCCRELGRLV